MLRSPLSRPALLAGLMSVSAAAWAADLQIQVMDRNGKPLPEAVVLLDSQQPGPRPAPRLEQTITQQQMRFQPQVSVVSPGAKVTFTNMDKWNHHVRGGLSGPGGVYLDPTQGFSFKLSAKREGQPLATATQQLSQPGPYLLGCHLHGSMRGHVYVSDTPWAAVSDDKGQVLLAGVPEGPARVRIWHVDQLVDGAPQAVQVSGAGGMVKLGTAIEARARRPVSEERQPGY